MWNSEFGKQAPGGFLDTTTSSPAAAADKKKPERQSNVVACNIAQILLMKETDENLKIGSMTARIVTFVGIVQSVDIQSTKITYVINDTSGPGIEVQVWLGENEEAERKMHNIRENSYVRVTGAVRSMKGRRHVIGFKVAPILELNELTTHLLEVIHTGMSIAAMDRQVSTGMDYTSSTATSFSTTMTSGANTGGAGGNLGLTKEQRIVYKAITDSPNDEGPSVQELFNSIKALNRNQIKDALEFLSTEGHIYTTVDDDHYKSTDNV